jgi:hypothetical protein
MILFFLFITGFIISNSANSFIFAQGCCTAGSSTFGGLERGITKAGRLNLGISFIKNSLSTTYNESEQIQDPLGREASVTSINFEMEVGLAEKISVLIAGGYSLKSRQTTVKSNINNDREIISFEGKGIGDIVLLGKYELVSPTIVSTLGISIGGGVKLPVGSFTQESDGSRLAIDLQPGTGSTDALLWGNIYKGFQHLNFSLFANVLYRYSGFNADNYRFGDEFIFSLNGEYYFTEYLTFSLSVRGRFADEDFWGGRFLPSTGGNYYDILPSLIYWQQDFSIKVFSQVPIYRNVKGIQLTSSSILGAEILFNFNLTKE